MTKLAPIAKQIIRLYDQGLDIDQIAKRIRKYPIFVKQHLAVFHPNYTPVRLTRRPVPIPDEIKNRMLQWFDEGYSIKSIAESAGISYPRTMNLLHQERHKVFEDRRLALEARAKEMADLRKSGMSLESIAPRFGISRERVRQILKRYGIEGGE